MVLIEKEPVLGGFALNLHHTIEGADIREYIEDLTARVAAHDRVEILTEAEVTGFGGYKGNFKTDLAVGAEKESRTVEHGVIVVATGAGEYEPKEFMYNDDDRVVTQVELTDMLEDKGASGLDTVVMIQCVGSRNEAVSYTHLRAHET